MSVFWKWVKNKTPTGQGAQDEGRTLFLDGVIDDESWWGDEVTPKMFRDELFSDSGDVTVWINSPGGSVFAADQIYNMLRDYNGKVTVKIDAIAASAASVIAMAGDEVLMSPVATMMIHNPATIAMGNADDLDKAIQMLESIKESILNAYMLKTGISHKKLSDMMDAETFLDAKQCVSLGFADAMIDRRESEKAEGEPTPEDILQEGAHAEDGKPDAPVMPKKAALLFAGMAYSNERVERITAYCKEYAEKHEGQPESRRRVSDMMDRLSLLETAF